MWEGYEAAPERLKPPTWPAGRPAYRVAWVPDDSSGTFSILIDDIEKTGFTFDPVNSVLFHAKTR